MSIAPLGSPFASGPKATNAWRVYELASGRSAEFIELARLAASLQTTAANKIEAGAH